MLRSVVAGVLVASASVRLRGMARGLRCEPSERYSGAASIPPVRVPDDLSVPDESNSLRLPPPSAGEEATAAERGLSRSSPPPFFEDSRLGDQRAVPADRHTGATSRRPTIPSARSATDEASCCRFAAACYRPEDTVRHVTSDLVSV